MNIISTTLIAGALFVFISSVLTLSACMLSSRISQTEELVELLVYAVNHQLSGSLAIDDQVE